MRLVGEVNYPKRRQKKDLHVEGVPEPVRETIYDIVLKNFKLAGRVPQYDKPLTNRSHFCTELFIWENILPPRETISQMFQNIINKVNDEYCLEKLTGFLLIYTKCFIHIVEGDEDSVNKHLRLLLDNEMYMKYLGTLKLLICVHHINQRFQNKWTSYNGTPSKLLEEINVNSSLQDTGRHIYNCIKKMYNLIFLYIENGSEDQHAECVESPPRPSITDDDDTLGVSNRF
ncbi:hypothetical protein NQ314_006747 [Rhamnusium bicolor]|uniref:Uncharacterized protein n=1 Tax=Rhamnusium bicolor TaxID=1586634 RepID=A0AAV8Z060_9CUCU|nr:hypothetical protein NQ314_006747 [Rhamnusium bicolor]